MPRVEIAVPHTTRSLMDRIARNNKMDLCRDIAKMWFVITDATLSDAEKLEKLEAHVRSAL